MTGRDFVALENPVLRNAVPGLVELVFSSGENDRSGSVCVVVGLKLMEEIEG